MTDALLAIGAVLTFSLLTFGVAWLMAVWMGAPSTPRRRTKNRRN